MALGITVNFRLEVKLVGREGFEPSTRSLGKNVKSLGFDFYGKLGFVSKVDARKRFESSTLNLGKNVKSLGFGIRC
ncbi:hypothetical protein [Thalassotalea euphylliae]|uniref:Uncharacterized protein n=1 Tax=Thalassotalea euphylliae TaxID=1655234 RepID=A0A3E0TJG7_9GAMM|nr:hypothetical protein [Thalassotalea euphylliae]REL24352.1 hypothetical protein DXX94_18540 [Thalassotalea euphylliae]